MDQILLAMKCTTLNLSSTKHKLFKVNNKLKKTCDMETLMGNSNAVMTYEVTHRLQPSFSQRKKNYLCPW